MRGQIGGRALRCYVSDSRSSAPVEADLWGRMSGCFDLRLAGLQAARDAARMRCTSIMSFDHFFSLASTYHQEGRFLLAETYYRKTMELAPDHRDARIRLAQVLIRSDRFDDGIALLKPLLNRPGDMATVYRLLGLAEACAGRRQLAIDYLTRALELAPDDSSVMHFIANLQQSLGLDSAADASFRRAVRSKPMVTFPAVVTPPDYRVLFLFTPGAGNTPFDYLIQGARFDSNVVILLPDTDYDAEPLRAKTIKQSPGTRVLQQTLHLRLQHRRLVEFAVIRQLRQFAIRHGRPQKIGQSRGQLKVIQGSNRTP